MARAVLGSRGGGRLGVVVFGGGTGFTAAGRGVRRLGCGFWTWRGMNMVVDGNGWGWRWEVATCVMLPLSRAKTRADWTGIGGTRERGDMVLMGGMREERLEVIGRRELDVF